MLLISAVWNDPEISFDATRVIFAMKATPQAQWHVYEMPLAGGPPTPLTFGPANDTEPHYLPGGRFVFVSNRAGEYGESNLAFDTQPPNPMDPRNSALWMGTLDGSEPPIRLSYNLSSDQRPFAMRSGEIVWSRWERAEDRLNTFFPLFRMRLDGGIHMGDHQGIDELIGNHANLHGRGIDDPREMPSGWIVAIQHYVVNTYRAGTLVLINPNLGFGPPPTYQFPFTYLSPAILGNDQPSPNGRYRSPRPLPDGRILLAYTPGPAFANTPPEPDFGLFVVDPAVLDPQGNVIRTLFLNDPAVDEVEPIPVVPYSVLYGQAEPVLIPPALTGPPTGFIGCADAGFGQFQVGFNPPKTHGLVHATDVKKLRVLRGIGIDFPNAYPGIQSLRRGRTPYDFMEVMGEVDLEADRSFLIEVPANAPFTFHTLDDRGLTVVHGTDWRQVFPGKGTTCTGCHARATPGPAFASSIAAANPPVPVGLSGPGRRIEYLRDVQPIFDGKCIQCHGATAATTGASLDLRDQPGSYFPVGGVLPWNRSYEELLLKDYAGNPIPQASLPVGPQSPQLWNLARYVWNGRARQSLLVWKLHGMRLDGFTNATFPNDVDYAGVVMPPPGSGVPDLTPEERGAIELWADLGACWSGGTGQNETPDVALLVEGIAHLGATVPLTFRSRQDPGALYVGAASLGSTPGFDLPGGVHVNLNPDPFFYFSLLGTGVFQNFVGTLDASGVSSAPSFSLPNDPILLGLSFVLGFVTFDPAGQALHASPAAPIVAVP